MLLVYIADAIWVVALSLVAGASRQAMRRIEPQTRVPMTLGASGWRAPRNVALVFVPALATMVGLAFLLAARLAETVNAQLLIFGVRAFAASLLALFHFLWLTAAMRTLAEEGALKP
ncbi:hypothetical protein [Phenylobacterium sp.]|jgi:hypothetical protein|uniref:hypothetical protein n=1 Tax=Phenylobacterium sp. TaxID=1871053 RepID=UPI002F928216